MPPPNVAIACQGGGSHAAFTAGVLAEILTTQVDRIRLVALSGTSGGAVCAALAWSGLLADGPAEAVRRLEGFWEGVAATSPFDAWLNAWAQLLLALPVSLRAAEVPCAEPRLRALLEHWVRPAGLPARRAPPHLLIGAADVLRGGGGVFREEGFTLDDVVASAAVPPLFRAVRTRGGLWWDGLYAHNPPIRDLLDLRDKPDEIWVVRLNPTARLAAPVTPEEIEDRRNEMAGNLPLDHELHKIRIVNRVLAALPPGAEPPFGWRPVTVRQVELPLPGLTYASKLDRSPGQIRRLMRLGREAAARFARSDSVVVRPSD